MMRCELAENMNLKMNPKTTLSISLILLLTFFSLHGCYTNRLLNEVEITPEQQQPSSTLDFASIKDISKRKQAFFDALRPQIEEENKRLSALRSYIQQHDMSKPSGQLRQLAAQYRIKTDTQHLKQALLEKVDAIPQSLVLAQAAIESAWGTSRFATQGNNLFGQWCFSPGCGIIPAQRPAGAHHEVKQFDSPAQSIQSYMLNLNSHPAYATLRKNRLTLRNSNEAPNGCFLAEGLIDYSERKEQYIASLKQLIRVNSLEDRLSPYCKKPPTPIVSANLEEIPASPQPSEKE
ncbi:hypothetical protein A9Q99_16345 [Gammaproteobacteria bacterium 45_16_T64]|nr:hypothetical protein A9Q99_16345 [Gammaproteobacteria bacterium 45_16_T64]